MRKTFITGLLFFFLMVPAVNAKPKVKSDIEKISQHNLLVTFSWRVTVHSDKNWEVCDLIISFRDNEGKEIYVVYDKLKLRVGSNFFSGHDICETKIWKRIENYLTTLDCMF